MSDFTPAWFLRSPHAQTIWGRLARPRRLAPLMREVVITPDDDEIVLDHLDAPVRDPRIRFVLMHGLEGSSYSVYIQGMLAVIARRGFAATAINFRSCARNPRRLSVMLPNRRPRFYHSGETGDFDFIVRLLASRGPQTRIVAAGASLGGNVLLKWLGENPQQTIVSAAATMSVPYDLGAGAVHLERGAGRFYVARFLRTLKKKVAHVTKRFPDARVHLAATLRSATFREFDDAATAPLHGFTSAIDYYTRSSSLQFLSRITTPTLCLSAEDDPFLPPEALRRAGDAASAVIDFRVTPTGGHTGFIAGRWPWMPEYWAERLMVQWLLERTTTG